MKKRIFCLMFGVLVSSPSFSSTIDKVLTVAVIGAQNGNTYFRVAQTLSGQCLYNVVFIDTKINAGRIQLSVLLTAKSMGRNLSLLEYTKDAEGLCWVNTIELE